MEKDGEGGREKEGVREIESEGERRREREGESGWDVGERESEGGREREREVEKDGEGEREGVKDRGRGSIAKSLKTKWLEFLNWFAHDNNRRFNQSLSKSSESIAMITDCPDTR